MGDGTRLRRASADDLGVIRELLTSAGLPLAGVAEHVADFIVAGDERLVACAAIERYGSAGLLRSVAVTARSRGTGIGRALVTACLAKARNQGVAQVVLLTETAEDYFARLEFSRIARDEVPEAVRASAEFRGACPESAVAMIRELSGAAHASFTPRSSS